MRLSVLLTTLVLAFALAFLTLRTPSPRPLDAPTTAFSAARAMVDIREISKEPHPLGSDEHRRVRNHLKSRLEALGFTVTEQSGDLTVKAVTRLQKAGGTPEKADFKAVNLIGVRKGTDSKAAPLLLMAHYDTVPGSPGAADDSTGIGAILETARALDARGANGRDLVVLFTDAEEIGLEGARLFFDEHPLASEIGFVINLEARGGGGRAGMFETGRGDGPTIHALAPVATKADGGVTATSLAVFMYERMPNGTDFTHARDADLRGMNFAFIGRAAQYHAGDATADKLDQGSVQHIGSQTLETAHRLMQSGPLPEKGQNRVYSDVFGRVLVSHPLWGGWLILGLSAAMTGIAIWRARQRAVLKLRELACGVMDGIWFLCSGFVLLQGLRMLAGPMGERMDSAQTYYTMLRRLPWLEAGAFMVLVALILFLLSGAQQRRTFGYGIAAIGVALSTVTDPPLLALIPAAVAAILTFLPFGVGRSVLGGWLGLLVLAVVAGTALQVLAPEAALIVTWPLLIASLVVFVVALLSPAQFELRAMVPPAVASVLAGAWLIGLGHFVFLGIGISLPGVLALFGLLILLTLRPLVPARSDYVLVVLAAFLMIGGAGLTMSSRWIEPVPVTQENLP